MMKSDRSNSTNEDTKNGNWYGNKQSGSRKNFCDETAKQNYFSDQYE